MNASLFPDLVVNGEAVPHAVVAAEAQNHEAPRGKPGIAWRKAANAVAMRTLLLQEARRKDLSADPQELAPGKFETPEEALIRTVLEASIDVAQPDADAVRSEWARNPERFRAPPLWEVSHILIACDPRDEPLRDNALKRATVLTAEVSSRPPEDFAHIAKRESDCGSKSSGGSLGQLGPGDTVPEFEAALRDMAEGQITSEPVLTRHGYHVIRLDGLAVGAVLPFEVVRQKIADAMEKSAWTRAARDFADQLVAQADISGAELKRITV